MGRGESMEEVNGRGGSMGGDPKIAIELGNGHTRKRRRLDPWMSARDGFKM